MTWLLELLWSVGRSALFMHCLMSMVMLTTTWRLRINPVITVCSAIKRCFCCAVLRWQTDPIILTICSTIELGKSVFQATQPELDPQRRVSLCSVQLPGACSWRILWLTTAQLHAEPGRLLLPGAPAARHYPATHVARCHIRLRCFEAYF